MGILKHILILRVRKVHGVILLSMLLSIGHMTFAECWGCFSLKGVRVETTNGEIVSGYVCWNPAWFAGQNEEPTFPKSILKSRYGKEWSHPLVVYKRVYPLDKPPFKDPNYFGENFLFLITSDSDMKKIPFKDIKDIQGEPKKHDGYSGTGEIPIFPLDSVKLMIDAEPAMVIINDNDLSLELFVSYNQNISQQQLEKRFEEYRQGKWKSLESFLAKLRRDKIILLEIPFD